MRLWMLVAAVLSLELVARGPRGLGAAPAVTAERLIGTWNGHWTVPGEVKSSTGQVELILGRIPGSDAVLGQFTFVTGATSRTLRYEGRIEDGTVWFPLVGGGRIVLDPPGAVRAGDAVVLEGDWVDTHGALPGRAGTLALGRVH
jgi:hypothetical protein